MAEQHECSAVDLFERGARALRSVSSLRQRLERAAATFDEAGAEISDGIDPAFLAEAVSDLRAVGACYYRFGGPASTLCAALSAGRLTRASYEALVADLRAFESQLWITAATWITYGIPHSLEEAPRVHAALELVRAAGLLRKNDLVVTDGEIADDMSLGGEQKTTVIPDAMALVSE